MFPRSLHGVDVNHSSARTAKYGPYCRQNPVRKPWIACGGLTHARNGETTEVEGNLLSDLQLKTSSSAHKIVYRYILGMSGYSNSSDGRMVVHPSECIDVLGLAYHVADGHAGIFPVSFSEHDRIGLKESVHFSRVIQPRFTSERGDLRSPHKTGVLALSFASGLDRHPLSSCTGCSNQGWIAPQILISEQRKSPGLYAPSL